MAQKAKLIVCVSMSLLVLSACKSRGFNKSETKDTASESSSAKTYNFWRATPPPNADNAKLREWWKYGRNWEPFTPEQVKAIEAEAVGDAQFLQDNPRFPVTIDPPRDYATDSYQKVTSEKDGGYNPLQYIRAHVATKDRNANRATPTPRPVAARTMLLTLRKLREMAWVVTPSNFGTKPVAELMKERYDNYPPGDFDSQPSDLPLKAAMIASAGDLENNTLPAIPAHWRDLQGHYYTQTGHILHGCYTMGIQITGSILLDTGGFIPNELQRRIVLQMCVQAGEGKDILEDWPSRYGITIPNQQDFRGMFGRAEILAPLFKYFYDTQWVMTKDADGKETAINVFDYMMLGSVYALNFKQQQAILNAFYIDSPYFASGNAPDATQGTIAWQGSEYSVAGPRKVRIKDSSGAERIETATDLARNEVMCNLFRPKRTQDINNTTTLANHCALDKVLKVPYFDISR